MKASGPFRRLYVLRRQLCKQNQLYCSSPRAGSPFLLAPSDVRVDLGRSLCRTVWSSSYHMPGMGRTRSSGMRRLRTCALPWSEILPYRNIRVNLTEAVRKGWALKGVEDFSKMLRSDISHWQSEGRSAVWLHIPISLSSLIAAASEQGFSLHHGKGEEVVMNLWLLEDKPNKLPHYATHQVGVCGVVHREDTDEVLMTQDRFKLTKWKFPGGLSDEGEDIAVTAVREVKEETGVDTEFQAILAFRQQHRLPNNFNCSDFYFVCRLRPLTFELDPCQDEVLKCQWMRIDELLVTEEATHFTHRILRALREGQDQGMDSVDIGMEEWPSLGGRSTNKLYLRTRHPQLFQLDL